VVLPMRAVAEAWLPIMVSQMSPSQISAPQLIARLIGPVFVVAGAAMIFNGDGYRAIVEDFVTTPALVYVAGFLTLLGGLAIVNVHNSWAWGWPLIITVMGWLGIVGGILRMAAPQFVEAIGADIYTRPGVVIAAGAVILVVGAFVSFKGYSA
jgi:hypothetical protein